MFEIKTKSQNKGIKYVKNIRMEENIRKMNTSEWF